MRPSRSAALANVHAPHLEHCQEEEAWVEPVQADLY